MPDGIVETMNQRSCFLAALCNLTERRRWPFMLSYKRSMIAEVAWCPVWVERSDGPVARVQKAEQAAATLTPTDCWSKRLRHAARIASRRCGRLVVSDVTIHTSRDGSDCIAPVVRSRHCPCAGRTVRPSGKRGVMSVRRNACHADSGTGLPSERIMPNMSVTCRDGAALSTEHVRRVGREAQPVTSMRARQSATRHKEARAIMRKEGGSCDHAQREITRLLIDLGAVRVPRDWWHRSGLRVGTDRSARD